MQLSNSWGNDQGVNAQTSITDGIPESSSADLQAETLVINGAMKDLLGKLPVCLDPIMFPLIINPITAIRLKRFHRQGFMHIPDNHDPGITYPAFVPRPKWTRSLASTETGGHCRMEI